jgi:hypothetical protein
VSAPARRGPAKPGRSPASSASHNAATGPHGTTAGNDARGSVVHLTGDAEALASDLLDRSGPAACAALVVALVELLEVLR